MKEYVTVVFQIEAGHTDDWWNIVGPFWLSSDETMPVKITAMSKADEITRLDCIRLIAERKDGDQYEMIEEIRSTLDVLDPLEWWIKCAEEEEAS